MRPAAVLLLAALAGCSQQQNAPQTAFAPQAGKGAPAADAAKPDAPARKVVYTAHVDVVVKDFDPAKAAVDRLVADAGGYVAKSDLTTETGNRRVGHWTLKVPTDKFQPLLDGVAALGVPTRNAVDSQDVTEEFVDVTARVKNLKAEEEALNKLLHDSVGKLEDVLKIRTQIAQVRGDIERAEGRAKYLATMSAMATVTVTLREVKDYVPPSAPTFTGRVGETFSSSVESLQHFGTAVALAAVALAPWLPFIAVAIIVFRWMIRRASAVTPRARPSTPRTRPSGSPPGASRSTPPEGP